MPPPGLAPETASSLRVEYGEVFTEPWVVELILDLCDYRSDLDLTEQRVVEPSMGTGAFLGPILRRLLAAKAKHADDTPWMALRRCIYGWDLQADHVEASKHMTVKELVQAGCPQPEAEALADSWLHVGDFLLTDHTDIADLVVGNPPYIRIEDIPPELLTAYRAVCPTMGGRADIFIGFYEHGLDLLAPHGRLGFICADRWMRNAYGKKLRRKIVDGGYSIDCVLTMHDVAAFDTDVDAYPAVTVLSHGTQGPAVTAQANRGFGPDEAESFLRWTAAARAAPLVLPSVKAAQLPHWYDSDDSWPEGSPQTLKWLESLAENLPLLEDTTTGTKISIGVATGADAVYVRRQPNLPDIEANRLLPLVMAADIKTGDFRWTGHHLISPWEPSGKPVDLEAYPKLAAYYHDNRAALTKRNVAKRSGRHWYRTIDNVRHSLLDRSILVMEDLKAAAHPVLVPPGYYPHHNLYYVISDGWDLEVLGGLLLSEVIERQVAAYCVKMQGGTLRFQAQYLRRVRCPRPDAIAPAVGQALAQAFKARDRAAATSAALQAYGMTSMPI